MDEKKLAVEVAQYIGKLVEKSHAWDCVRIDTCGDEILLTVEGKINGTVTLKVTDFVRSK